MNIACWLYGTAIKTPDAPALFEGRIMQASYIQFVQSASALGERLKEDYHVGPGDRVALCLKNRVEYLEILYAAWWIGAVVVPINAKLHPKEVAWIVENVGPKVLFTDDGILGQDIPLIVGCQELGVDGQPFAALKTFRGALTAPVRLAAQSLAWIFYTSGTTGKPKGVMLSHGNLVAMSTCYTVDVDQVSSDDAILYAAPMSHGAGLYNFIHVRYGAKHVVPSSRGFKPLEIFELASHVGELSFFAAPIMINRLVEAAKVAGYHGDGIKSIIYGGAPMYVTDIEKALDAFGPKFVQIYGQGESPMTISALGREMISDKNHPLWRNRLGSVGTAQSCIELRVVGEDMHDLPPGESGEIVVRGPTVMQGYWRNDEATRNTIVDGWLKTGDIGHLDEYGFLTMTDRSKDVIISGGTNIYPREVEEVLLRCSGLREVAVVGMRCAEWGEQVVAFVVVDDYVTCNRQSLDAFCREEMAGFKCPKRYEFRKALPKNAYGKIKKMELRLSLQRDANAQRGSGSPEV
tara:strand:- start:13977 stop:15536 length:1560 start_codon:yes stop_codon:yes gene_type:complete